MAFLTDPVGFIQTLLSSLLGGWGLPTPLVSFLLLALGAAIPGALGLMLPLFTIWVERRVIARMQDRIGPNRVGPMGLLQSIADVVKLLFKEDITPTGADRIVYTVAPVLAVVGVLAQWAVIPFGSKIYGVDLNVGALYIIAVGTLSTLAIKMAGWASNNKYALLSAFRAVAQLVSYEVPLIVSMLVPVLLARSLSLNDIARAQDQSVWFIFPAPLAALIFFIASVGEVGRAPFDLLEADSEIVAGFNLEYSAMKFGMFFVGEFTHAFTVGLLTATFFLGGWSGPWAQTYPLLGLVYFIIKASAVYFIVILLRGSLPRLRIDQMLNFNWKFLTPVALATLMGTMLVDKLVPAQTNLWVHTGVLLLFNVVLAGIALGIYTLAQRRQWSLIRQEA
jgi:NADH-quinone oxidoreductase subunit H